jgi:glucosamine-6-phosphate deaminase
VISHGYPIAPGSTVSIYHDKHRLGHAAAGKAAALIRTAVDARGSARILIATGNSQLETVHHLVRATGVPWEKVDCFHLDEYVGIKASHPASFRHWIASRFAHRVHPRSMHYIEGDARDLEKHMRDYADALFASDVDIAFVGFGENGHIAFNDPPVANFSDPFIVKRVTLDEDCRKQQVGEGHFRSIDLVPSEAVTVTCPALYRARHWICAVPDARKRRAAKAALEGPVSEQCPASLVQRHPSAHVFLDADSSRLLSRELQAEGRSSASRSGGYPDIGPTVRP